ncbi:SAM-dependent methyltransferase [Novosphingobium guangzhouense]|uniref:NodS family protein n=1 Tax=Novosphingobium guangzhouense TaxID=1850347 RepID=A0A2K2FY17_9SPHN|nr:SAM-dependent methyltransferase [Novosphingobium guangzhouense]PNU03663.1 NodS family protein [Novosphingobium guangzhouense]
MTRHAASMPPEYFEAMFLGTPDPWDLETSAYEQAKYRHSIEALGARRYAAGLEVGCAKGVLTRSLAGKVASLFSLDVSGTALRAARRRCADLDHVGFANMRFPAQAPDRDFDLIVLSEVAYYWHDDDLAQTGVWLQEHLVPGGDLLLVHWTGETDYPQDGDEVVNKLHAIVGKQVSVSIAERRMHYRLDLWRKTR